MPYYHTRTCPICQKADLQDISRHFRQVHKLSSAERKPYLKVAQYQLQNGSNVRTNCILSLSDRSKARNMSPIEKRPAKAIIPAVINHRAVADKNRQRHGTRTRTLILSSSIRSPCKSLVQHHVVRRILYVKCSALRNLRISPWNGTTTNRNTSTMSTLPNAGRFT